ncbi:S-layer homology domain-containing protein, partial [Anaerosphaera multitolerans]
EKDGKLTVKKEFNQGDAIDEIDLENLKFKFKVTGPESEAGVFEEIFELKVGESKTLEGLYYGEYKVEEIDSQKLVPSYRPASGVVKLTDEDREATVTVTNEFGEDYKPNLEATKTDNLKSRVVERGDRFKYYINVKNTGSFDLANVKISDKIPSKLDIVRVSPSSAEVKNQSVEYLLPELKVKETFTLTIEVKVNNSARDGDRIKNIAVVNKRDIIGKEIEVRDEPGGWYWWGGSIRRATSTLNREEHQAYLIGYPDGTVRPEGKITRAEVTTIFFRLMKDSARDNNWSTVNNYSDVSKDDWYNNAISTLSNAGAVTGYPDGTFRPDANMTRAEFASMASKFLLDRSSLTNNKFVDIEGNWAEREINNLMEKGLISGYPDGSFKPDKEITRAEAVTLINAVFDRKPDKYNLLSTMKTWKDNTNTNAWYYAQIQEATNSHECERESRSQIEKWTKILPPKNWDAFEKEWSKGRS